MKYKIDIGFAEINRNFPIDKKTENQVNIQKNQLQLVLEKRNCYKKSGIY